MKKIRFHPAVEKEFKDWPMGAKSDLAELLGILASGVSIGLPASRPMNTIAAGVSELRIKERSGQYRAFYFTKNADAILVFHAFKKKTQATPIREIATAKERLRDLL